MLSQHGHFLLKAVKTGTDREQVDVAYFTLAQHGNLAFHDSCNPYWKIEDVNISPHKARCGVWVTIEVT